MLNSVKKKKKLRRKAQFQYINNEMINPNEVLLMAVDRREGEHVPDVLVPLDIEAVEVVIFDQTLLLLFIFAVL